MSDQLYCPECADKWSGAYNTDHRCVTCGSPLKAGAATRWVRPSNCRNELQSQGRPYPKSGCEVCGNSGRAGCPYDMQDISHLKAQWQAEAQIAAFEGVLAYCKAVPEAASNGQRVLRILRERTEAQRTVLRHQAEETTP